MLAGRRRKNDANDDAARENASEGGEVADLMQSSVPPMSVSEF